MIVEFFAFDTKLPEMAIVISKFVIGAKKKLPLAVADDQRIKILTWHVLIRESSQLSFVYAPFHFLNLDHSSRMTI